MPMKKCIFLEKKLSYIHFFNKNINIQNFMSTSDNRKDALVTDPHKTALKFHDTKGSYHLAVSPSSLQKKLYKSFNLSKLHPHTFYKDYFFVVDLLAPRSL